MQHADVNIPLAPQWALTLGAFGRGFVLAGVALFCLAVLAYAFDRRGSGKLGSIFLIAGCASVFGALLSLATLFVNDQFTFQYVYSHSEKQNAFAYKIAAIWSGQEGSFLLWASASALFVLLTLWGTGPYRRWYGAVAAVFLGAICGILAYESPFVLQLFEGKPLMIPDGVGLSPTLNNYWVIIHPPTIFLGFGSLIVPFAYAVAALGRRDYDDWVPRVRPWSILTISLLGLGLCMGGFWAYETLGWGGFWKWDPVENVSFVPWVLIVVFVHGLLVQATRNKWQFTNVLLGGVPFLAFTYGTFLTRAGFLDKVSVHSFAQMNASAHRVLLWFLIAAIVGFAGFWVVRFAQDRRKHVAPELDGLRRDGFYATGNLFLTMLAVATGIGMSVPLIQFAMGRTPKVVDEPLYHDVLVWFFVPIMLVMAVAPFVPWRRSGWSEVLGRVMNVFSLSLLLLGVILVIGGRPDTGFQMTRGETIEILGRHISLGVWMLFLGWLCLFTVLGNLWRLMQTVRKAPLGVGAFVAHAGVALAMAGLIVSRGLERRQEYALQPGLPAFPLKSGSPGPILQMVAHQDFDFFKRDNKVQIEVSGDGEKFIGRPGLYYTIDSSDEPMPVTWPHVQRWLSHDLYLVLYPLQPTTGTEITLKPGETKEIAGMVWAEREEHAYKVTYKEMVREGEAGMAGTKFGAAVHVVGPHGAVDVTPKLVVGGASGPSREEAELDTDFSLRLERMNAADKSVTLALAYKVPVFPVELYYKPLTILVWLGVGILTLGGLIAAWDRRRRRPGAVSADSGPSETEAAEREEDALVPVP